MAETTLRTLPLPAPFRLLLASAYRLDRRKVTAAALVAVAAHAAVLGALLWATSRPKPLAFIEKGDFFLIRLPDEAAPEGTGLAAPPSGAQGEAAAPERPAESAEPRGVIAAPGPPPDLEAERTPTFDDIAAAPVFTPFTVAPRLSNRGEVVIELQRRYPLDMLEAGTGGRVILWFLIDEHGDVRRLVLKESSGEALLDAAAMEVAQRMRFTPAMNRGETVPVWVSLPIEFRPTVSE